MNTQTISRILTHAVLLSAATVSLAVRADNYSETFTRTSADKLPAVTVSYADLNLDSSAGQEALRHRINEAARQVCGPDHWREAGSLRQVSQNRKCRELALSRAMSQLPVQQLAATGD